MSGSTPHFDYVWEVREKSVKSCIGYVSLFLGMLNYATSMYFISQYVDYNNTVEDLDLDEAACELESAWVMVSYCSLFQVLLGSMTCLAYIMSCFLKTCYAAFFACPGFTTNCKKKYWKIPTTFNHYESEFDFECDESQITIAQDPPDIIERRSRASTMRSYKGEENNDGYIAPNVLLDS